MSPNHARSSPSLIYNSVIDVDVMEPGASDVHHAPKATTTSNLPPPPSASVTDIALNDCDEPTWALLYSTLYELKSDLEKQLDACRSSHQIDQTSWRRERNLWDAERNRRHRDLSTARREIDALKRENAELKGEIAEVRTREHHLDGSPAKRRRPSRPESETFDMFANSMQGNTYQSTSQGGARSATEKSESNPDVVASDPPSPPTSTVVVSPPPVAYRRHAGHTPAAVSLLSPRVDTPTIDSTDSSSSLKHAEKAGGTGTTEDVDANHEPGPSQDVASEAATEHVGRDQRDGHTSHSEAITDKNPSSGDGDDEESRTHADAFDDATLLIAQAALDPVKHIPDDPALSGPLFLPAHPMADQDGILAALGQKLEEAAISPEARTPSVLKDDPISGLAEPDSLHGLSGASRSNGGSVDGNGGVGGIHAGHELPRRTSNEAEEVDPAMDLDGDGGVGGGEEAPLDVPIKLRPTLNFGAPLGSLRLAKESR
ncbi:hypothetical protein P152DRAFT_206035 [Eremomyces bilateralis CBS 781.70]|uniref:Uncharacterized protein n=1 Tax=Eremomyces bilateralis CBS 781.70 TaxID=1392243 RepID=A0A6G1FSV7_9PEZI|nr:uncharacterized protein P152DRAFT_206035 [Eremomyces bilateralis CBS 781.70]KAF1808854.1 hypothetical protein P152DRAFT_206035 [Eremomyces bilateralis CBS 781.70]